VEYSFDEGEWHSTPEVAGVAGANEQIVVGIPYEMSASWRVVPSSGAAVDGDAIATGDLDNDLPLGSVVVSDSDSWYAGGNYLLTSISDDDGGWNTRGDFYTFIMDRKARVVWASRAPGRHWTLFAQIAKSGDHILWDEATYWSDYDGGEDSTIHKTYLDEEIEVVGARGLHHAFVQMPDGTLAWGSQDHGGGEALALLAPGETTETIIWNCDDDWPGAGRCESNGLFYSLERDAFIYSFYTNSSIVEVDRATGTSTWWAGTVRNGYDFVPSDSQFEWQHGISYLDSGNLLVSTEYREGGGGTTTAVVEYEVDHTLGTLTKVWAFDSEERAQTNGAAWRLENGNTLHIVGSAGHVKEANADSETVWHVNWGDDYLMGDGQFIDDLYGLVSPAD